MCRLTGDMVHEVLAPIAAAGEIICNIDRMKIGFALNTELKRETRKCPGKRSLKPGQAFSLSFFFFSDTAENRRSEEEE